VLESMNAANVFVLSSDYETFGIVLIEALACGLPIIATTSGGPECIANDINGILVEPRNIDQLASAMSLTKDHYSRYSFQAIRDDCIARFGPSRIINQTIDLYNNVLRASSDN
ncbi:MAG: glycosyltransferase, partial [Deltaproteobacteria bacterium]|nr:glycosyltransferase [Deltaproteobacteria bacterium]